MINKKDLQNINISATKKDFYQVWNELLDNAAKLSERWTPDSTNEADPGIVLLKVLAGITDKLNYNIDKNILEAFMPSAAQEESMRKLCEMLGYNVKYYQSATTEIEITCTKEISEKLEIPQGTTFTNKDNDVNYILLEPITLTNAIKTGSGKVIEGSIQTCENNNNNIITISQLDDNFKYYLPETAIAENGIFVYNVNNNKLSDLWEQVTNLNVQPNEKNCYKFGFDSRQGLPYLQFPEDVGSIIKDGLYIQYIRTNGLSGNISAYTLTVMNRPGAWTTDSSEASFNEVDDFVISQVNAAANGTNIETINNAYNNYKKTIGTFDTLVTCRDYINKIYSLVDDVYTNIPLCSNVIVTDIRDDINRAYTLCSFDQYGIKYVDTPEKESNGTSDKINHFDLLIYPFKTVYGINDKAEYKNSFNYDTSNQNYIKDDLEDSKTIAHNLIFPSNEDEIACIKNYLKLNARITTTSKVTEAEGKTILAAVKNAIYSNFNMRQLDFGEEIPEESILSVIENADERIKYVSLDTPKLYTCIETLNGKEYNIASEGTEADVEKAKKLYNKLALRNILAGRVAMFNYDTEFSHSITEKPIVGISTTSGKQIKSLESTCNIGLTAYALDAPIKLTQNEYIKFRAPNFMTKITYPAYVNYRLELSNPGVDGTYAEMQTFIQYLTDRTTNLTNISSDMFSTVSKGFNQKYSITDNTATKSTTGTYYVDISNIEKCGLWRSWIQAQTFTLSGVIKYYSNIYRKSTTQGYSKGKLVDDTGHKYLEIDTYCQNINDYYIQKPSATSDGLGSNATPSTIKANSEYLLQNNDTLYINYTPANSDESSASEINYKYTADGCFAPGGKKINNYNIIKPNFDLKDATYLTTTPTKILTGIWGSSENITNLYSLDASQQIEIRTPVEVTLWNDTTGVEKNYYVYWELQDINRKYVDVDRKKDIFPFDSDTNSYILQAGEYFYMTDESKLSMNYYGSGTEIKRTNTNLKLENTVGNLSAQEILLKGIKAVNWLKVTLSDTKNIIAKEYQYITLSEEMTLDSLKLASSETDSKIDNKWREVVQDSIKYESDKLLPTISSGLGKWEVRSGLQFNFGPNTIQELNYKLIKESSNAAKVDKININYVDGSTQTQIATTSNTPIIDFKGNYLVQSINSILDAKSTVLDDEGEIVEEKYDLKLNFFLEDNYLAGTDSSMQKIDINKDSYTSISFNNFDYLRMHINLPSNEYGLILLHYTPQESNVALAKRCYLSRETGTEITAPDLAIFNVYDNDGNESWWTDTDYVKDGKYYLKNGLNIIKLKKYSGTIRLNKGDDGNINDIVVLGKLDLVKYNATNLGINNSLLNYKGIDAGLSGEKQLLKDLRTMDPSYNFYYNAPIDNSLKLDINEDSGEQLSSAKIWYDANNLNNKFVISEIDADYLKTGLTISEQSKK